MGNAYPRMYKAHSASSQGLIVWRMVDKFAIMIELQNAVSQQALNQMPLENPTLINI
jgi:hypothetical protein